MSLLTFSKLESKRLLEARQRFEREIAEQGLKLQENYFDHLFQVACWLARRIGDDRITFGISGAQGSGKSTFAKLLASQLAGLLERDKAAGIEVLGLDDFYLTRADRLAVADKVHPLLKTRGVPGTHDLPLLKAVRLAFAEGRQIRVPQFDKGEDDRLGYREVDFAQVKVLILEGWCWGAVPAADVAQPINSLEQEEDPAGTWRRFVNEALRNYQPLFQTNHSLFLKVPNLGVVAHWRWQQEQQLSRGSNRLQEAEVAWFVAHYERITRHLLDRDGEGFDLRLTLDDHHGILMTEALGANRPALNEKG